MVMKLWDGWYTMEDDGSTRPLNDGELPMRDIEHRRVAESTVGELWVSTVFLGMDHNWLGGPPILFETMVFPNRDDMADMLCWRYATKVGAAAGHAVVVAALEAGTPIEDIEQPDEA